MIGNLFVKKSWGYEIWFANIDEENAKYCGKELFVECGLWSSKGAYHYHIKKDETFYILSGDLQLEYIDGSNFKTIILKPGESFRIKPWVSHRFTTFTKEGCKFIEASTPHHDEDSHRCKWNGKDWIEIENPTT